MINLVPNRADYYRQTNNQLDPNISCFGTSVTAGLDIKGSIDELTQLHSFPQPEDNLRWFILNDPEVITFYKRSHPGTDTPAPEWGDVMVFAVNKIYKTKKVYFDDKITFEKIDDDLGKGLPLCVSMRFPERKVPGHYVLVVGKTDNSELIINDPFKNFLKNTPDGYNCLYTPKEYLDHAKGWGIRYIA